MMSYPEVTKRGGLDMQLCVPETWSDEQVVEFANQENLCVTTRGWQIRREGSELLRGDLERVACDIRVGHVHVMLDA